MIDAAAERTELEVAEVETGQGAAGTELDIVDTRARQLQRCIAAAAGAAATARGRGRSQRVDEVSQLFEVEPLEIESGVADVIHLVVAVVDPVAGLAQQRGELGGGQTAAEFFVGELLGQRGCAGDEGGGLAGALHGGDAARRVGTVEAGARREGVEQGGVALREGRDLVGAGAVVGRSASHRPRSAKVGRPGGAHRDGRRVAGRVGDAHPAAELQVVVACRRHHDGMGLGQGGQFVADAVAREVVRPVAVVAEGEVHHADIEGVAVGDHPLQGFFQIGKGALAGVGEHFQVDQAGRWGDTRIGAVLGADDAGNVRAVTDHVTAVQAVPGKVVVVDDAVIDAVAIEIGAEEAVAQIDAGIDHRGGHAATVQVAVAGFLAQLADTGFTECGIDRQLAVVGQAGPGVGGPGAAAGAVEVEGNVRRRRRHIDRHGRRQRLGLHPAVPLRFGHRVRARQQIVEAVVALSVRRRRGFAGVQHAVGIGVQEDGPSRHARLARIPLAIAVQVVELAAADVAQLDIADVVHQRYAALDL